jgi:hypothetical protein
MGSWEELDRSRVAEPSVDEFTRLCASTFAGGVGGDLLKMFRAMTIDKTLPDNAPESALRELEAHRRLSTMATAIGGTTRPSPTGPSSSSRMAASPPTSWKSAQPAERDAADMTWMEANGPTYHRSTIRTGMPAPTWRQFYQGVAPTKNTYAQVDEAMGMMEARSVVDVKLADLESNAPVPPQRGRRLHRRHEPGHAVQHLIYGNQATSPHQVQRLAPRFNDNTTARRRRTSSTPAAPAPTTPRSGWSAGRRAPCSASSRRARRPACSARTRACRKCSTPAATATRPTRTSSPGTPASCVKDWRYRGPHRQHRRVEPRRREAAADILKLMTKAVHKPPQGMARARAFYCNNTVLTMLDIQAQNKANVYLTVGEEEGQAKVSFRGIPIRRVDQLTLTEARSPDRAARRSKGPFRCCSTRSASSTTPTPTRRPRSRPTCGTLGPVTSNTTRDLGAGEPLHLSILITTTVTTNVSTVFTLESDDNTSLSSPRPTGPATPFCWPRWSPATGTPRASSSRPALRALRRHPHDALDELGRRRRVGMDPQGPLRHHRLRQRAPSDWRAAQAKAAALAAPAPPAADPDPVAIPPDWADQRPEQIINLARRLGAPVRGTNARAAVKFIEAQIKARADHDAADDEGAE